MTTSNSAGNEHNMRLFKDVYEVLLAFDPIKPDADINNWICKLEEYALLYSWDEVARKHYALAKLEGVARKWRDSLPAGQRSWTEWKELLVEAFPCDTSCIKLRLDAQEYSRKPGQDIVEYYYEKLSRCNRAKMSDQEAVEWIVQGLKNTRFRDFLGPLAKYTKANLLLPDLKSANHLLQENSQRIQEIGHANKRKPTMTCYNCNGQGHAANRCSKPRKYCVLQMSEKWTHCEGL
ncbi:uncharacterized protein LOC113464304 [Ceratina calcarata]|uniref:Uncharacterized protein LOC113464304 n=1 Tax=Ceratina calcarata TaxID=156304 RepID=A0AAJ7S0N9_9HYME|nr:uncharacterized protein LOC113464304 [Ceratina calcarata]